MDPRHRLWEAAVHARFMEEIGRELLARGDIVELARKKSTYYADQLLDALLKAALGLPEYKAVCLICSEVHGYRSEEMRLELQNNTIVPGFWDRDTGSLSTGDALPIVLNLPTLYQEFHRDGTILRDEGQQRNQNLDHAHGIQGRYRLVVVGTGDEGTWLRYPTPLLGGQHTNTAVNRLFYAFMGETPWFTLIE